MVPFLLLGASCLLALRPVAALARVDSNEARTGARSLQQLGSNATGHVSDDCPKGAPARGESCVLMATFSEKMTVKEMEDFGKANCPAAATSIMTALHMAIFTFPPEARQACCDAFRTLPRKHGVHSVEFDQEVRIVSGEGAYGSGGARQSGWLALLLLPLLAVRSLL